MTAAAHLAPPSTGTGPDATRAAPLDLALARVTAGVPEGTVVLAALTAHEAVGTLIAVRKSDAPAPVLELQSLLVQPEHRRRGVATRLVSALIAEARSSGVQRIVALVDGNPGAIRALERAGFVRPGPSMLVARGSRRVLDAPCLAIPVPAGTEIVAWPAVAAEAEAAEQAARSGPRPYPDTLAPLSAAACDPTTSVGLRRGGRVVGWMLTQRATPDTLCYARLYVAPEARARGAALALVAAAIRRQVDVGVPYGTFVVRADAAEMVRLLRRRLAPYLEAVTETICLVSDVACGAPVRTRGPLHPNLGRPAVP